MKTLTVKLPEGLLGWMEKEAARARQPKSALVREILLQHHQRRQQSALDLAADLCGFDGAVELASGARYDPVRDVWAAISSAGAPSIRQRHTAVWRGTEMLVWSGRRHNGLGYDDLLDDAYAYAPPRTMYLYLRP